MTIRSGSKGTKDPAAANWDRVFGKPPKEPEPERRQGSDGYGALTRHDDERDHELRRII